MVTLQTNPMRHGIERISATLADIAFILSPAYRQPRRGKLLADYLRMRMKVFLNRWIYFKQEKFLGFTVVFANYSLFFEEFRQIFVRQSYYFNSKTDDPTIIDCGGNAGVSILYFKHHHPRSKVTVFEPSRDILPVIRKNIEMNQLTDVRLEPFAVSSTDGKATFYDRGTGSCGSTLMETVYDSTTPKKDIERDGQTVETRRLSPYIKGKIDLLKLDIEGAEGLVIKELSEAGALQKIGTIVMEYHYYPSNTDNSLAAMLDTFERGGRTYQIYLDELTPGSSIALDSGSGYYCLIRS